MKNKSLSLGVVGVLAMLFVLSFVSAATISGIQTVDPYANSFTVQLNGLVGETATIDINDVVVNGNTLVDFEATITHTLTTVSDTIIIDYTAYPTYFQYGKTYSSIMEMNKGLLSSTNYTINTKAKDFCENCSNAGNLKITIENINVVSGFGDDDNYWYPMDEVEIELTIENDGNWDIKSIDTDWALYTTDGKKIADDELSTFKLKEGDDKTLKFTIKLDEDISDFEGQDVILYAKAKGTISDNNAGTHDNEETGSSDSVQVQMITDDNFVILDNFELSGVELDNTLTLENYSVICGEEIEFLADVWNIQSDDEQDVSVNIYNKELGINQKIEIGDVDAFDKEDLNVKIKLPSKIESKWYSLLFEVLDEDGDIFENSEDGVSSYNVKFKIEGCNVKVIPLISAELNSEAESGKDLTVKTIITNPGNSEVTYNVKISEYSEWAELKTSENTEITLKAGESKEVEISFKTNKNAVGDKFFNVEILSGDEVLAKQPVAVTLEKSTTQVKDFIVNNWKLIGIILLNLILVIAIITVIVKIYRR